MKLSKNRKWTFRFRLFWGINSFFFIFFFKKIIGSISPKGNTDRNFEALLLSKKFNEDLIRLRNSFEESFHHLAICSQKIEDGDDSLFLCSPLRKIDSSLFGRIKEIELKEYLNIDQKFKEFMSRRHENNKSS